jgi:hypothetical protein
MGERPSKQHSIDRITGDGDYTPGNCRWATQAMQARNKSNNHWITFNGETLCITDWGRKTGISHSTLRKRIKKLGWSVEKTLTTPPIKP